MARVSSLHRRGQGRIDRSIYPFRRAAETERRWQATTPQWPIMHAVFHGVSRDQMMARHKANHIQVVNANSAAEADRALLARAAMADALGMRVCVCGTRADGSGWR